MKTSESKNSKHGGILFLGFFFILCVGVGSLVIYSGISDFINTKASLDWPYTNGTVIKSELEQSGRTAPSSKGSSPVVWYANIEYEYTVDNLPFRHYRVSYGDYGSSDQSHARTILDRYPVGKTVTVYYKANDPAESVLEPEGTMQGIMLKLIGGAIFVLLGTIIILLPYLAPMIKRRFKERS